MSRSRPSRGRLRVVVVAYAYPPLPAVGSIRAQAVVDALLSAGHDVIVLTAAEVAAPAHCPPRLTLVQVPFRENLLRRTAARMAEGILPAAGSDPGGRGTGAGRRITLQAALRRHLFAAFFVPDDLRGFIRPVVEALDALRRRCRIDLLYSTAPPHSTHLAALIASRLWGIPWIAEFRDPWSERARPWREHPPLWEWLDTGLERSVVRHADRLVAVTTSIAHFLDRKRRTERRAADTTIALNGVPATDRPTRSPGSGLRLLHAGSVYLHRDPRPVLEAVAGGINSGRLDRGRTRVTFLGDHARSFAGQSVSGMAADLGVGELVEFVPQVRLEQSRARMAEADALLLLAQDQPAQIPNKLYDYLAARRPIIAYADAEGESAAILRRVGGHTIIPDNSPEHADRVVQALLAARDTPSGAGMDEAVLDELRTEVQMAKVVAAIEEVAGTPRRG